MGEDYLVGPTKLTPRTERWRRFEALAMGIERATFELELSAQALIGQDEVSSQVRGRSRVGDPA